MRNLFLLFLLFTSAPALAGKASWPAKGTWEIALWSGGGSAISGSTSETDLLLSGLRFSKILTQEKEGGGFPGNLQLSMEVIPLFLVFQRSTVYGIEAAPMILQWNFHGTQGKVIPYVFGGAGALLTNQDVPEGTSSLNFTPQAGIGWIFPVESRRAMSVEIRYMHISNGGFSRPNPGINSIQLSFGYHWLP